MRSRQKKKEIFSSEQRIILHFVDRLYNQIGGVVKYIYFNKTTAFEWSRNCFYVMLFLLVEIIIPNNIKHTLLNKTGNNRYLFQVLQSFIPYSMQMRCKLIAGCDMIISLYSNLTCNWNLFSYFHLLSFEFLDTFMFFEEK